MQGRSRMAALTLVVGAALTLSPRAEALDRVVVSQVQLELGIAGLATAGCDVEVKPGHGAVNSAGHATRFTVWKNDRDPEER